MVCSAAVCWAIWKSRINLCLFWLSSSGYWVGNLSRVLSRSYVVKGECDVLTKAVCELCVVWVCANVIVWYCVLCRVLLPTLFLI